MYYGIEKKGYWKYDIYGLGAEVVWKVVVSVVQQVNHRTPGSSKLTKEVQVPQIRADVAAWSPGKTYRAPVTHFMS